MNPPSEGVILATSTSSLSSSSSSSSSSSTFHMNALHAMQPAAHREAVTAAGAGADAANGVDGGDDDFVEPPLPR